MKYLGYTLFILGTAGGAVTAINPRISWPVFIPLTAVGLAGVILLRICLSGESSYITVNKHQKNLASQLEKICLNTSELLKPEIWHDLNRVKTSIEKIEAMVTEITDDGASLTLPLGFDTFSRIFVPLAQGERNLHRAWSALVDGYEDESFQALKEASASFRLALDQANSLT